MNWDALFAAANLVALIAWAGLIFLPRWPALTAGVLYLGVMLLCGAYTVLLALVLTGTLATGGGGGGGADFTTIEGVQTIFASEGGTTIGWIHYLAFDLFAGLWIARDADAKEFARIVQAPILLATFLAGPLGQFAWLIVRERRARASGRPR